ncbi:hypothetical protein F2Q70_00031796 [Brassica cretica]|uniref:Uncharacterized protein n=1 Tax=Brassica cretica TaxID=69181 RepID=A0A8S9FG42_BRACR|nr:hypothetical protein F2Q70_00031796 [Brassica cretica]
MDRPPPISPVRGSWVTAATGKQVWEVLMKGILMDKYTPPLCFSRRDKAVATDLASIGARTKPLEPLEVTSPRARSVHAPLRRVADFAAGEFPGKPPPPSVVAVGDRRR